MLMVVPMLGAANNPPGIEIVEPGHGDTVSGTITIWMCAWDPDGNDQIQNVWVRIDAGPNNDATFSHEDSECSWWFYVWDTTTASEGWHTIHAAVFDGIDDGSDAIEVIVDNIPDNNPPGVEIIQPNNGDTVSGNVTILICAWDPDGNDEIQDVWVKIDNGNLQNATYSHTDSECSWWIFVWDTTTVEDGWHLVTAVAYDGIDDAHDSIEVHVDNEVDNSPPGVAIHEPSDGETVSGTITIWICAWDPDGNDQIQDVWVKFDNGPLNNATFDHVNIECSWWFYEWDTTTVEDGWHLITAIAFDGIDDAHDAIEVYVDNEQPNHPPGVDIIEPAGGSTVSGTVTIWICAWDMDGNDQIQDVWVKFDNGPLNNATHNHTNNECSWWYYEWDTTTVEDGWHLITAVAFDGIDDAHDSIEVYVDNEPENSPPGVEIIEPDHGETVSGTIVIWICAWDPDGNDQIQDVWVRFDNGAHLNATYNHTNNECSWWYYEWDTTTVEDGWHLITAIAFDGIDDAHDSIEVYVDNEQQNNPPHIEITEPDNGATVSGTIVIWMCAWDLDGNDQITSVWVKFDNGPNHNATHNHTTNECSWWFYEWDTTTVENGWHLITAIVFDGIDDGSDSVEVFVENEEGMGLNPLPPSTPPPTGGLGYPLLAFMIAMLAGLFSAAGATEVGKFALIKFMLLPLYTKIRKKDILDHFVRGEIFGYIKVNPGDNYTTIKNNLDLSNSTLTYHLSVLEREGLVKSWSSNGHKYFYPADVKVPGNGSKNPSIHDAILKSIRESPGISVRDVAAVNGISTQLANYHIRKLALDNKIELERKSFSKVCYPRDET
jgi:predicted transcriptional regulator